MNLATIGRLDIDPFMMAGRFFKAFLDVWLCIAVADTDDEPCEPRYHS
jgi:hypothetical protein